MGYTPGIFCKSGKQRSCEIRKLEESTENGKSGNWKNENGNAENGKVTMESGGEKDRGPRTVFHAA